MVRLVDVQWWDWETTWRLLADDGEMVGCPTLLDLLIQAKQADGPFQHIAHPQLAADLLRA
jgi:hypothetical protein